MRAIVFVLLAGCGAQPNQPALANVPRPNPAAVAGGAAAAAAAITLASPDSHNPEKKQDTEKKAIKVKENVPAAVLDRADATKAEPASSSADAKTDAKAQPKPDPAGATTAPKAPRDALDFSNP